MTLLKIPKNKSNLISFKRLLTISRPVFWPLTFCSYLLGTISLSNFDWLTIIQLILFTFPMNLYIYGLNDIYDKESDEINARKGDIQGAIIKDQEINQLKKYLYILPVILVLSALFSVNILNILFMLVFIVFNILYSYGNGKIKLKGIPIIDSITSTIIYFSPLFAALSLHINLFEINPSYLLLLLPPTGIHSMTTLKDISSDKAAGINTIGVALGLPGTLFFSLLMFIIPLLFFYNNVFIFSVLFVSIFLIIYLIIIHKKLKEDFLFAMVTTLLGFWILSLFYFFVLNNRL